MLCIPVAFNDLAHAAMLVHEMQIVKQLAEVCTSASDVTGEARLETIRARLVAERLRCATSSSFLPLFHFVVDPLVPRSDQGSLRLPCACSARRVDLLLWNYFGKQHINNIASKHAKAFALA